MITNQCCLNIHHQLQKDCLLIGRFPLCRLLLAKDANYPWFILVPDRIDITEIYQLSRDDQIQLIAESSLLAGILKTEFHADKINIGALGNLVPQLHIHHIARYKNDVAWPAPIWGKTKAKDYLKNEIDSVIKKLKSVLIGDFIFEA